MPFNVGENIGPYRIIEQLGQGGMATVFKAYHASLDRYVAIKALHPAFNQDVTFESRFQREARLVAKLEHPNIVPIYDFAEHEKRPFLVMKFIEGITLKARIDQGPLTEEEIRRIVDAVGSALAYAHKQGILHRDIKPSNVLLATDGLIYLADFGLARMAQAGESTLSSDTIMGTPQYISPEQAMGRPDLDQRTDLYSFGVMLYEMLVGKVPYSADTPFSVIHDHIYSPLPLPRSVNPNVPEALERFLLKALAKERNDRFENAERFVDGFREAWRGVSIPLESTDASAAAPIVPGPTAEAPVTSNASRTSTAEVQLQPKPEIVQPPKKKRPAWMWVGAVLALLLCCVVLNMARNNRALNRPNAAVPRSSTPTPDANQSADVPLPQKTTFVAIASKSQTGNPPSNVLDGNLETIWMAGEGPVQWVQIDLGKVETISQIVLVVAQDPAGRTVHEVWGGSSMQDSKILHEFIGQTSETDKLRFLPVHPIANIRYIRVVTRESPSWVAWREIEIQVVPSN